MNITRELLEKIATLARLKVKESEAEQLMNDMSAIVTWMEQLNEINTDSVEPLTTMTQEVNAFREDVVNQTLAREDALSPAPRHDDTFFQVPKVLD